MLEDIPADCGFTAGDIGVGLGAQASAAADESVEAVHGLLGHGLPGGASLGVDRGDGFEDFAGAGFTVLGLVEGFRFAAYLSAHRVRDLSSARAVRKLTSSRKS